MFRRVGTLVVRLAYDAPRDMWDFLGTMDWREDLVKQVFTTSVFSTSTFWGPCFRCQRCVNFEARGVGTYRLL